MSLLAVVADWTGDPTRLDLARRMIDRLAERAPDGTAAVQADGAALGIGKLVVSRRQGHAQQPLVDEAAGLYLVADARIDNREELRAALDLAAGATDSEIVLAGYKRWGPLVPDHLIGDFAFAVWDARERRLFAARDPFGVRPLVYRRLPDGLLVASDVEQILAVDPTAWKVDDVAIVDYLLMKWRFAERTVWEPIKSLPPGHCLMASDRSLDIVRWWRPPAEPDIIDDHEACYREFRRLFRQAISDRLESDHPALIHLSGGFDSSCIALVAATLNSPVPLRAVGVVHPGLLCDESIYMDAVKARLPYPVEYWDGTRPNFDDLEHPSLSGPARRNTWNNATRGDVQIAAREGARVILSGIGGDVWAPCGASLDDYLARRRWRQLWVAAFMRPNRSWKVRFRRLGKSVRHFLPAGLKRAARKVVKDTGRVPEWLTGTARQALDLEGTYLAAFDARLGAANLRRLQDLIGPTATRMLDLQHETVPQAHVEKRFPFLDSRCVDLLWRLPLSIWQAPAYEARFQATAFRDLFPPELLSPRAKAVHTSAIERKMALAGPVLASYPRSLASGSPRAARYFDEAWIEPLLVQLTRGEPPPSPEPPVIWQLLALEPWLKMVYGEDP